MNSTALEAHNLTKKYKHSLVIDHINLRIEKGKISGFIGQNGAGKTTFLRLTAGLSFPTDGTLNFGTEEQNRSPGERKRMGCLIESPALLSQPDSSLQILRCRGFRKAFLENLSFQTVFE